MTVERSSVVVSLPRPPAGPPPRPIVHIGYHKTATTWFQRHVYPAATSHRWAPRMVARDALLAPCGLSFDPAEARRRLMDGDDGRPVVICEENLSGYIHNGGLHGLMAPEAARRIHATLPDARIVVVIRNQPEAIAASYVQYVRGGGTHGPGRYLFAGRSLTGARRHAYKAPAFAFEHFEYDRLIAFYDRLFGRENVIVLTYEDLRRNPAGFLADYADSVGLRVDVSQVPQARANASFGPTSLLVGRALGLFTDRSVVDKACLVSIPGFYEVRRLILGAIGRFDRAASPAAILGQRTLAHIVAHYGRSNLATARLRDLDLSALNYPMPETCPSGRRSSRTAAAAGQAGSIAGTR